VTAADAGTPGPVLGASSGGATVASDTEPEIPAVSPGPRATLSVPVAVLSSGADAAFCASLQATAAIRASMETAVTTRDDVTCLAEVAASWAARRALDKHCNKHRIGVRKICRISSTTA
jgi:hypothetical protein